jgi:uncharacterized 2Fe-2S/4Fe-4S cluster protein (DUF4445 family)
MFEVKVKTEKGETARKYEGAVLLSKILSDCGLYIDAPCGGAGTCGKCRVWASGALSPLTPPEKERLTAAEIEKGARLACQARAVGGAAVRYDGESGGLQGVTAGRLPAFEKAPPEGAYAAAIDVGTTTIAACLFKLPECTPEAETVVRNEQRRFGADVIARIESAAKLGVAPLAESVWGQISDILKSFGKQPDFLTICGNTTMLHLLEGLNPAGIGAAPFTPESLFGYEAARDGLKYYLPACVSAYVGADITCGVLASELMKSKKCAFLVDVGTNGEMALWDGEGKRLKCCSTAAGPAFEGALIEMGMTAANGAICKVWAENGGIRYETIGNKTAKGICGSGLVDAVAAFLELGLIDETGMLADEGALVCEYNGGAALKIGAADVCLTAKDVRQVQLAKAAVRAGIETLLAECGKTAEDVERFYIAGGFGAYLDLKNAARVGLIPEAVLPKAASLGNAALTGAAMLLLSKGLREASERTAREAETVELSGSAAFMEKYVDNMMFT